MSLDRLAYSALSRLDQARRGGGDAGTGKDLKPPDRLPPGRFRVLFHKAPVAILLLDARGRILDSNEEAVRLCRWSKEALRRTTLHALVSHHGRANGQKAPCRWEGRLQGQEGSTHAVHVLEGRPLGGTEGPRPCFLHDVEADRAEEARYRSAEVVQALGGFASGLAHELGNRLTALVGHLELLRPHLDENAASLDRLDDAMRAGDGISRLVRDLEDLSPQEPPRPEIVDLKALLRGVERKLRDQLSPTVSLEIEVDAQVPALRADPRMIERALIEIATAARRAMPRGGCLSIEADATPRDGRIEMRIRDTGAPLVAGRQGQVFVPLTHIREGGETAGLNLAVVRAWLVRCGVDIEASEGGTDGLVLRLRLPVAEL